MQPGETLPIGWGYTAGVLAVQPTADSLPELPLLRVLGASSASRPSARPWPACPSSGSCARVTCRTVTALITKPRTTFCAAPRR